MDGRRYRREDSTSDPADGRNVTRERRPEDGTLEVEQNLRAEIDTLKRHVRLEATAAKTWRAKAHKLEAEKKASKVLLKEVRANGPRRKVASIVGRHHTLRKSRLTQTRGTIIAIAFFHGPTCIHRG